MRFASVRLIHAQGVPNHYIANQIYTPVDEDHQKRGGFVILLDQVNTKDGSFVASLVNTLIREYYRQPGVDLLTDFEHALVRLNSQINQFYQTQDAALLDLHGSIVLVTTDEIHITYIGQPLAFLARDGALMKLVDNDEESREDKNLFSVITSGEVKAGDILVVTSPLNLPDQAKADLQFSLKQLPLFESGRAYARILKQKLERQVEAIFIDFNDQPTSEQVYVDRPLESFNERMAGYQKEFVRHGMFVYEGVQFVLDRSKSLKPSRKPLVMTELELAREPATSQPESSEPVTSEPVTSQPDLPYRVKGYWQSEEMEGAAPTTSLPQDAKEVEVEEIMTPLDDLDDNEVKPTRRRPFVAKRTVYLLVGVFILLFIVIKAVNAISSRSPHPIVSSKQNTGERDGLVNQADAAERDAEAAQINDDSTKAITSYMAALDTLKKIASGNENDKSRALVLRANQGIKTVTHTTELAAGTKPQTASAEIIHVTMSSNGVFVTNKNNSVEKYSGDAISAMTNFPTGKTIVDSITFDSGKNIAYYTTDQQVLALDTNNGAMQTITRSDSQNWPKANHIASLDKNLYLVGDTITKAVPSSDTVYTPYPYNPNVNTSSLNSVVINSFFYAIDGTNQIVRIDSKSPKNPLKLTGVPASWLPKTFTRILTTDKDGVIYIFDKDGQRVLEFSTDGVYHKQWLLPKDATYTDCDMSDTSLVCAHDKQIKTFSL